MNNSNTDKTNARAITDLHVDIQQRWVSIDKSDLSDEEKVKQFQSSIIDLCNEFYESLGLKLNLSEMNYEEIRRPIKISLTKKFLNDIKRPSDRSSDRMLTNIEDATVSNSTETFIANFNSLMVYSKELAVGMLSASNSTAKKSELFKDGENSIVDTIIQLIEAACNYLKSMVKEIDEKPSPKSAMSLSDSDSKDQDIVNNMVFGNVSMAEYNKNIVAGTEQTQMQYLEKMSQDMQNIFEELEKVVNNLKPKLEQKSVNFRTL